MPSHTYSKEEALKTLLKKIAEKSPGLYNHVLVEIDKGIEEIIREPNFSGKATAKEFRKRRQLTTDEAIAVVMKILKAYMLELPACGNAVHDIFKPLGIARLPPRADDSKGSVNESELALAETPKEIQLELLSETVKSDLGTDSRVTMMPLSRVELQTRVQEFNLLKMLVDFS